MRGKGLALAAGCLAMVSACGGGGGGGGGAGTGGVTPTPTPSPTPAPTACSLRARQNWALAQLNEWYLFPTLLAAGANPASYATVQDYIDALVAPARAQNRDRYFTYLTSIAEENAYYEQGEVAGFGFRLALDSVNRRLYVTEAFEGGPGLAAGIDRGDEITHVGTSPTNVRTIGDIMASGGTAALVQALGPDTDGTTRTLVVMRPGVSNRTVTVTKTTFDLDPVSNRYGAKIVTDGAKKVGYINLRTFIDTAEPDLIAAFADFKAQGVTELIIDLRYNGGGLISIAELMGDLMGEGRAGQISGYITFRDSKASLNESRAFQPLAQSIAPTKIAFIGTEDTASASELVINGMVPYLGGNMALVGSNTYVKPVGQIALDRPECDDRLRAVALKVENANHQGDYYNGLATTVANSCRADDDIDHPLGDPNEAMVKVALDFLAGRSCTAITAIGAQAFGGRALLTPERPRKTTDFELPGAF